MTDKGAGDLAVAIITIGRIGDDRVDALKRRRCVSKKVVSSRDSLEAQRLERVSESAVACGRLPHTTRPSA